MKDLGESSSYLALKKGAEVYSSDGEHIGRVTRVLADPDADVFDGIVLDTTVGPGGQRFVDGPEVGQIFERGLVLKITAAEVEQLPKPSANPSSLSIKPGDLAAGRDGFMQRMWNRLSGKS